MHYGRNQMLRYSDLRELEAQPRVHGNGFIQLDLSDGTRLHVWDYAIPRQKVDTQKHDHAFGFESKVICGTLINVAYDIHESKTGFYMIHTPQRQEGTEDTKLMPTGERVNVGYWHEHLIPTGKSYSCEPQTFHETYHRGLTATIIKKTQRLDIEPRILVPFGKEPDNEFDRDSFDPDTLWPFVERALELANAMEEV